MPEFNEVHNKYLRYNEVVRGKHLAHTNSVQDSLNSSPLEDIWGLGVQKSKRPGEVEWPLQGTHCYFNLRKSHTCTISHHTSEVCCMAEEEEVAVK